MYFPIFIIMLLIYTGIATPVGALIIRLACHLANRTNDQPNDVLEDEDEPFNTTENIEFPDDFDPNNPYAVSSATQASTRRVIRRVPTFGQAVLVFLASSVFFHVVAFVALIVLDSIFIPAPAYYGIIFLVFLVYIASCLIKSASLARTTLQEMSATVGPIILDQAIWFVVGISSYIFLAVVCAF
jgi:hypothetical protein